MVEIDDRYRAAARALGVSVGGHCPTPEKLHFTNQVTALNSAKRMGKIHHCQFRPYHCGCGFWHLTTVGKKGKLAQ